MTDKKIEAYDNVLELIDNLLRGGVDLFTKSEIIEIRNKIVDLQDHAK